MSPETSVIPEDRLITLDYIAGRMGISSREMRRNIPGWKGFPNELKLGHRTVRYSLNAFNQWFDNFKSQSSQPV